MNHANFDNTERIYLIMIVNIKKEENVNVWIQSFNDVKVESNKIASTNIQRLNIASKLIQGQANKIKKKIRPQTISLVDWFFP